MIAAQQGFWATHLWQSFVELIIRLGGTLGLAGL